MNELIILPATHREMTDFLKLCFFLPNEGNKG